MRSHRFNVTDTINLLDTLIGDTTPVGDSYEDNIILFNVKDVISIIDSLLDDVIFAAKSRHCPYGSARMVGEEAYSAIIEWKKICEKTENDLA